MPGTILDSLFEKWPSIPYVMFGVFYAWLDLMTFSSLVFTGATPDAVALRILYQWLYFGGAMACNLLCIVFHRPLFRLLKKAGSPLAAAAFLSACTLLCVLGGNAGSTALIVAAALFGAVGQTYVTLLLVLRFVSLPGYQVFINVALLRVLAAILYFMIAGLPRAVGVAVLLLLPFLLSITTAHSFKREPMQIPDFFTANMTQVPAPATGTGAAAPDAATSRAALARILIASFALVFAINAAGFGGPRYWSFVEILCVAFALVLIVLLVYRSNRANEALSYWFYLAFIAVLLAFALAAILPVSTAFNYIVCGSFRSVFDAFYLGFLILILRHSKLSPVRITGLFYGCYLGAVIAGLGLNTLVTASGNLTAYSVGATVFAMLTLTFLLVAFTPKDVQLLLGITIEQPPKRQTAAPAAAPAGAISADTVAAMAARFQLSQREAEVMEMLLQGYTVNMISSRLVVSASTTKTHMHHIYSKAGVGSREELLLLAQELQAE